MIRGFTLAVLLALDLAAGSDPGDDLPPALAGLHQWAVRIWLKITSRY